ncbi:MAG: universal stress protein [Planctomycetes bacterium]|nr:universal stress protein [Planctomycetota bacterium]
MPPFRRILVPTDFSELSNHAALYASALAEIHQSEIHSVHVVTVPTPSAHCRRDARNGCGHGHALHRFSH